MAYMGEIVAAAMMFIKRARRFVTRCAKTRRQNGTSANHSPQVADLDPPHPAIAIARERWKGVTFLRVDPDERCVEPAPDGTWVRSWIKISAIDAHRLRRYDNALASLPLFTREVYLAHRSDSLDYHALAHRYGITAAEVERLVADALLVMARFMRDP